MHVTNDTYVHMINIKDWTPKGVNNRQQVSTTHENSTTVPTNHIQRNSKCSHNHEVTQPTQIQNNTTHHQRNQKDTILQLPSPKLKDSQGWLTSFRDY